MSGDVLHLPFAIREAIIAVAQKAFWTKEPLLDLLQTARVPDALLIRYKHEPKVTLMRDIVRELDGQGSAGIAMRQRILQELLRLKSPHPSVENQAAARQAFHDLKALNAEWFSETEHDWQRKQVQRDVATSQVEQTLARQASLKNLHREFQPWS